MPLGELTLAARQLAFALDLTMYGALAQQLDCALATADKALASAMATRGAPGSGRLIR